jgi:hypothetical protein
MKTKSIAENKALLAIGAFVYTAVFTLWEYVNDGVATHHLFADKDLPGASNWWGLVSMPLLAWIVSALIKHRRSRTSESLQDLKEKDKRVFKRLLAALLFGITASILWELKLENVLQYFILLPILIAFFRPVHLPEYLLGFTLGMIYSFGGILPIFIGLILIILCFLVHKLTQLFKSVAFSKKDKM